MPKHALLAVIETYKTLCNIISTHGRSSFLVVYLIEWSTLGKTTPFSCQSVLRPDIRKCKWIN